MMAVLRQGWLRLGCRGTGHPSSSWLLQVWRHKQLSKQVTLSERVDKALTTLEKLIDGIPLDEPSVSPLRIVEPSTCPQSV